MRTAVLLTLGLFLFPPQVSATDCSIASTAMATASRIRGLRIKRSVPCKLKNRQEVEKYLRSTIATKIPPEKIRNEGRAYKLLGVIPMDYDYLNGLVQLYTSQLGGYYEPEGKYYAMASWMPAMMQMPIAVHELTHALQDQHYNLSAMIDHNKDTSDALMARSALVEGDATAVMMNYSRELNGQGKIENAESISGLMMQNIAGAMLSSGMQKVPSALQAMLVFPYVSGLNFAHALLRRGGFRYVNKVFKHPPASTEEVLHPELYFTGQKGFEVLQARIPDTSVDIKSEEPVFRDRLGEFLVSTILGTWLPPGQASEAASGWGGDLLTLYEHRSHSRGVLIWDTRWDTTADAEQFFHALTNAYQTRFGAKPEGAGTKLVFPHTEVGRVEVTRESKRVVLVVG